MNKLIELADAKGKACAICAEMHPIQNRCRYETLAKRITLLKEANGMIPSLLAANKEAVTSAEYFQMMLKESGDALTLFQEICQRPEFKEVGEKIWETFSVEGKFTKCQVQETLVPGTEEPGQINIEHSTLIETESKPSTEATMTGGIILSDS